MMDDERAGKGIGRCVKYERSLGAGTGREAAERELEEVVGPEQLGEARVERDEGRDDAERAAGRVELEVVRELRRAEAHEGEREEEEERDERDVLAQRGEAAEQLDSTQRVLQRRTHKNRNVMVIHAMR